MLKDMNVRVLLPTVADVGDSAYLEENPSNNSWLDDTLIKTADCSQTANPFPSAYHLPDDDSAPPYLHNDIVVPTNVNFNVEIHNEDYHYTHLMAGFVKTSDNTLSPLAINDPNLEALLFPDLFPNGK
ncbi:unnamed protein product [Rhizophagus irregularis]|nr:unnamed protein product [Rhizophagus irregularis]